MVNLKCDPKMKQGSTLCNPSYEGEEYPWGLRITLDDETLDKLGLGMLPKVGGEVTFTAKAVVTSVSQHECDDGDGPDTEQTVCLQITDMQMGAAPRKSAADKLYGNRG